MSDISSPRLLYLKGILFVLCGTMAAGLILLDSPSLRTVVLLTLSIWCFARAYYFAFYVIEHYIDGEFRFSGLGDFFIWTWKRSRNTDPSTQSTTETDSESVS